MPGIRLFAQLIFTQPAYYTFLRKTGKDMALTRITAQDALGLLATLSAAFIPLRRAHHISAAPVVTRNMMTAGMFFGGYGVITVIMPQTGSSPSLFSITLVWKLRLGSIAMERGFRSKSPPKPSRGEAEIRPLSGRDISQRKHEAAALHAG